MGKDFLTIFVVMNAGTKTYKINNLLPAFLLSLRKSFRLKNLDNLITEITLHQYFTIFMTPPYPAARL